MACLSPLLHRRVSGHHSLGYGIQGSAGRVETGHKLSYFTVGRPGDTTGANYGMVTGSTSWIMVGYCETKGRYGWGVG